MLSDFSQVGCKFWCCLIISIIAMEFWFDFNSTEASFCDSGDCYSFLTVCCVFLIGLMTILSQASLKSSCCVFSNY